jgi:hypothetical protein
LVEILSCREDLSLLKQHTIIVLGVEDWLEEADNHETSIGDLSWVERNLGLLKAELVGEWEVGIPATIQ